MPVRRSGFFFALLLLFAAPAGAEPVPGGEIHVERSDRAFDCPNESELVNATLALGSAPAAPGTAPISIAVRFDRDPSSYVATVSTTGQKEGERELRADDADCKRLADSVAVVLAVLLDLVPPDARPAAAPASLAPAPNPAPPAKPTAKPRAPAPPAASLRASPVETRRAAPEPPLIASVRAEGALAYGLLGDAVSPVVGGAVALGRGPVIVALGGDWVDPRNVAFDRPARTDVHLTLAYGFADGCFRPFETATRGWDGSLCGRFAAGVFSGDGRGFDRHFPKHDAWFAAGPLASLRYRVGRAFALRLDALGLIALGHQTLRAEGYGGLGVAYRSLPLAGGLAFGPELSIW